jgi:hypothetical protein
MRILLIPLVCLGLAACMPTPEPTIAPASTSQAPGKETDTEMRDAIQAPIEKAKGVEDQVLEGADKQKADIEAAGG